MLTDTGSYKLSLFPWHSRRLANEPAGLQKVRCCCSKIVHETLHLRDPSEVPYSIWEPPRCYVAALCSFPTCGTAMATVGRMEAFSKASMSSTR